MAETNTTTPPSTTGGAPVDSGPGGGVVAGVVLTVLLVAVVCSVLLFLLAKRKGWVNVNAIRIPKLRRLIRRKETGDVESTNNERISSKADDLYTTGSKNTGYEMCLPVNIENGVSDETDRPYLEIIAEPAKTESYYENVRVTPVMRIAADRDKNSRDVTEPESDIYINYGSDVCDHNAKQNMTDEDKYYVILENNSEVQPQSISKSNDTREDGMVFQNNYFVLEAPGESETSGDHVYSTTSDFGDYNKLHVTRQDMGPYDVTSTDEEGEYVSVN